MSDFEAWRQEAELALTDKAVYLAQNTDELLQRILALVSALRAAQQTHPVVSVAYTRVGADIGLQPSGPEREASGQLQRADLEVYMDESSTSAQRDVAYLRMFAEKIRNGTALTDDIPNTLAATLEDIGARAEAAEARLAPEVIKALRALQDQPSTVHYGTYALGYRYGIQVCLQALEALPKEPEAT